jgi:hypothetical protein
MPVPPDEMIYGDVVDYDAQVIEYLKEECANLFARLAQVEAENSSLRNSNGNAGTSACPMCGIDKPHGHSARDVAAYIDAQASRFGYRASVFHENMVNDRHDAGTLKLLREVQHRQIRANGREDEAIERAISLIERMFADDDQATKTAPWSAQS